MNNDYRLNDTNYINIQGWMISRLNLKGNELIMYALIHGFCQDKKSVYSLSFDYLQKWLNASRDTVAAVLASLLKKGLIDREVREVRGNVKKYNYWTKASRISFDELIAETEIHQSENRTGENSTSQNSGLVTSQNSGLVTSQKIGLNNSLNNTLNINSSSETEFKPDSEKKSVGQKEEEPFLNFIKKKFGSAQIFTKDFKKKFENHLQNNQISHAETENYLNFVYELCQKKKPSNMSAYFFTTCLNDVTAANYIHQKINGAPEKKKNFRCPVCGCMHSTYEDCPKCGLDINKRNDDEVISILKKAQNLHPEQRHKLDEEMAALTMEFMTISPNRWPEQNQRRKQIYAKYGLLEQKIKNTK